MTRRDVFAILYTIMNDAKVPRHCIIRTFPQNPSYDKTNLPISTRKNCVRIAVGIRGEHRAT